MRPTGIYGQKSIKLQTPSTKQIPIDKIQNFKQNRFGHWVLELGIYLGFEIWNLRF
jgi:hypothetical protein